MSENYNKIMESYNKIQDEQIYLIQEREHVMLNNPVYKVGKSKQGGLKRIKNYSRGSCVKLLISVPNCDIAEKLILKKFNEKYELFEGNESFIGDCESMINDIYEIRKLIINKNIEIQEHVEIQEPVIIKTKDEIIFDEYISKQIIKTNNLKDKITKQGLNCDFKMWFECMYGHKPLPKLYKLYEYMDKNIGIYKPPAWCGVKFYEPNEEENDSIAEL